MGCFPTNKSIIKDSKKFFNQQNYPSTEIGNSIKVSINPKLNELAFKTTHRRNTKIESKYSIIKRESLEFVNQYKVINTETNKIFLMTQIAKASIVNETDFVNTLQLMIRFRSLHLINIIDSFTDEINYYIITEYFDDTNLLDKISSLAFYNENIVADVALFLFETIDELSSLHLRHNAIDPKRIYLNQDMTTKKIQIKINGLCYIEEYISYPLKDNYNILFTSPELMSSSKVDNHNLVWSIGVILFCLFIGELPFNGITKEEVLRNIKSKGYIKTIDNSTISPKGKLFLKELLTIDHKKRIDSKTILFHPFFECLNNKERCTRVEINEFTLFKIKGIYAKMSFIQYTNVFVLDYLDMRVKVNELMPIILNLVEQKENDSFIEEVINKNIGSSINKMKINRVKEETSELSLNHYELLNGIVYNWYKINQKYYRRAFNLLCSLNKNNKNMNKSELIDLFSYSESKEIINVTKMLRISTKDSLTYEEYESILIPAVVNGNIREGKEEIQKIITNKDNDNLFKDKWPFADNSYDMSMIITGKNDEADSSASSSDDS